MIKEYNNSLIKILTDAVSTSESNASIHNAIKNVLNDIIKQLPTFAENFLNSLEKDAAPAAAESAPIAD